MATAGTIVVEMALDDKGMYTVINRVGAALREFQKTTNQTAASVKKLEDTSQSISTKFRHLVTTLGNLRFAAMDVHDVFLRLPIAVLKTAGELERTRALLGGLSTELTETGRAAESAMNFDYITKMAQKAPFEISALSDSFVKLKSAGLDPTKGSLQALVDGVAKFGGTGETMKRASVALQQMLGKGVISMEELRQQLGEAIPTAMRDMATGMGLSMAELTKAVSKGTVEAADALNKMLVVMGLRNKGAAEKMMGTWIGVQAQIKTRMQLAAEEIATAGFGDAMKKVALDVSNAMNSIQFKRLTDSVGSGLGEAVVTLSNFAKLLIEHADLIKTAALAWVVYKVSSAAIGPGLTTAWKGFQKISAEYEVQKVTQLGYAEAAKVASQTRIQGLAAESRAQMVASAQTIAALQAEMVERRAVKAALLDSYAPAKKAVMSASTQMEIVGAQQQIALIRKMDVENNVAMRNIARDIGTVQAAHGVAATAVLKHGNTIDTLAGTAAKATGAMAAMGAASNIAGKVLGALGGWTLALNLAIMAGIYLWMNWGKAAEEALARSERARKGLADQKDLDAFIEGEKKATEAVARARLLLDTQLSRGEDVNDPNGGKARIAQYMQGVTKAEADLAKFTTGKIQSRESVTRENARKEADNIVRSVDTQIDAIRLGNTAKLAAIDTAFEAEVKAAGKDQSKLAAASKNKQVATVGLARSEAEAAAAGYNASIAYLATQINGPEGDAVKAASLALRDKLDNANNQLAMAISAMGGNKIIDIKGDGKKGPLQTKIQAFITGLQEDIAKMDAALPGLLSASGKIDSAAVALAAVQAKFFEEKGKDGASVKVNAKDFAIAQKLAVRKALFNDFEDDAKAVSSQIASIGSDYQNALAFLANPFKDNSAAASNKVDEFLTKLKADSTKIAAYGADSALAVFDLSQEVNEMAVRAGAIDLAAAFKPVIDKITAIGPDYEHALMVLANPLGANDQTRTNQFDDFLAKIKNTPEALQAAAGKYRVSIDKINAMMAEARDGSRKAATIDLANSYKSMVDENRKLGLEMVQDDRERTRMQIQAENELAAARAKGRIDEAVARKVDQAEVEKMQNEAAQNAILRAEKLRLDTRGPLEKLADDWGQSLTKMDQASAQWSTSFVDMITNAAMTGKLEFGGFVKSVLADVLKISLQKSLGRPLQDIMGKATDWIKEQTGTGKNEKSVGQQVFEQSMKAAAEHADLVKRSFADMTGMGIAPATKGMLESIATEGQQVIAASAFSSSMGSATAAVYNFIAAMQGSAGASVGSLGGFGALGGLGKLFEGSDSFFQTGGLLENLAPNFLLPFADGGIMSSMGSVPLRKYAAGGIASSPQMALFGEGSQNEAYVPLPDGRRIPVAMQGGANVTVNVINQSGTPVSASKGQPRFDGKQMILDVVLTAASQPGGFRDGMKGALN